MRREEGRTARPRAVALWAARGSPCLAADKGLPADSLKRRERPGQPGQPERSKGR
jgi:hypothetical protein